MKLEILSLLVEMEKKGDANRHSNKTGPLATMQLINSYNLVHLFHKCLC